MKRWKRAMVWLGRIGHCRGFGVQSPSAYRFVRYVINEHAPYYAYKDLALQLPHADGLTRKLCKLYFRLSNYCQAVEYVEVAPPDDMAWQYVHAACHKTLRRTFDDADALCSQAFDTPFLARMRCCEQHMAAVRHLLAQSSEMSVVVVEGIKENRDAKSCWESLTSAEEATVTYDLYYCGIIITTKRRYKHNYIINF